MLILCLDSSEKAGSLGLFDDDQCLCQETFEPVAENLLPILRHLLGDLGKKIEEIELLSLTKGPGSFTGLRIGLTFAKLLGSMRDIPVVGISTLRALAVQAAPKVKSPFIGVMLPARFGEVFAALYRKTGSELLEVGEPTVISVEEFLRGNDKETTFVGSGARTGEDDRIALKTVAMIGKLDYEQGIREDLRKLVPLYMRRSAAEENLTKE